MKTFLYVGNFEFPYGNAAGKRVYGNGKALKELGYDISFVGLEKNIEDNENLLNNEKIYDGFKYYNFSYPKNNVTWIKFYKAFKKLKELIEKKYYNVDGIIIYGSPRISMFNYLLVNYCKKHNIKIISDCVDWLSVNTGNKLFDSIKWLDTTFQKRYINIKVDSLIVISSYLKTYYKKYIDNIIIIPPLSTNILNNENENKNEITKFIYAGLPFRKKIKIKNLQYLKDRIDKIIELFYDLKLKKIKFECNIYGFTKEEYLEVLPMHIKKIDFLENSIKFHGHKENKEIITALKKSDFTILIRDIKRDSLAGFPTKVSESLSFGIPVITNETSDLKKYIKNYENGYLLQENKILEGVITILNNKNNFKKIKENKFYYKNEIYINEFKKIFK